MDAKPRELYLLFRGYKVSCTLPTINLTVLQHYNPTAARSAAAWSSKEDGLVRLTDFRGGHRDHLENHFLGVESELAVLLLLFL